MIAPDYAVRLWKKRSQTFATISVGVGCQGMKWDITPFVPMNHDPVSGDTTV